MPSHFPAEIHYFYEVFFFFFFFKPPVLVMFWHCLVMQGQADCRCLFQSVCPLLLTTHRIYIKYHQWNYECNLDIEAINTLSVSLALICSIYIPLYNGFTFLTVSYPVTSPLSGVLSSITLGYYYVMGAFVVERSQVKLF